MRPAPSKCETTSEDDGCGRRRMSLSCRSDQMHTQQLGEQMHRRTAGRSDP